MGTGHRRTEYRTLVGKPEGKNILCDLNADGNIIVKWKMKERIYSGWPVRNRRFVYPKRKIETSS